MGHAKTKSGNGVSHAWGSCLVQNEKESTRLIVECTVICRLRKRKFLDECGGKNQKMQMDEDGRKRNLAC